MIDYKINMPILSPVRIPTKGISWWKRFFKSFETRSWRLEEDYILYMPWLKETLLVPKGFIFDGASIPRLLWPILNPTGILFIGSLFHDFGYKYNGYVDENFKVVHQFSGQKFCDDLIRDISTYVNDSHLMEGISFYALRAFGWAAWNNHRRANSNIFIDFKDREVHA